MKILHAVPGLSSNAGGPSRSIPALASSLGSRGFEPFLLRRKLNNEVTFPDNVEPAEFYGNRVSVKSEANISLASFLGRFDIVHSHGLWTSFNHYIAAASSDVMVVAPRGTLEPLALNHKWLKKRIAWWLYQRRDLKKAKAFHATSQREAENIRRLGFRQPIAILPNGVDLPQISHESLVVENKDSAKKIALFLGRLHPIKNLPSLITAWSHVAPLDWHLHIVGDDDHGHRKVLENQASSQGVKDRVFFFPPVSGTAKAKVFQDANLLILPSYTENFGIVVAEALAHGLPVLTTTGCPWKELVRQRCGWWVEPTPEGIATALNEVVSIESGELHTMGDCGREWVLNNYQWPMIAEKTELFYEWILNGGVQPDFVI